MASSVIWESVNLRQISRKSGEAFAAIGNGRISLSATACELIDNIYNYNYVEVQFGKQNGKVAKIGLRFTNTKTATCLNLARRKYKGQIVEGLNINSRALIAEFFGKTKDNITTRYAIEKIDQNMLAIDITREF